MSRVTLDDASLPARAPYARGGDPVPAWHREVLKEQLQDDEANPGAGGSRTIRRVANSLIHELWEGDMGQTEMEPINQLVVAGR